LSKRWKRQRCKAHTVAICERRHMRDYLKEQKAREELQAREADENARAIATARRYNKNVTFIAHDGCEVTVTPGGHVFHNAADWY
jgi:hypothetical protein